LDANDRNYRYVAPEVQWPETHGKDKVLITKESDIYEMAMTIYEARSHEWTSSGPVAISDSPLLGLVE
jgi:hypothetical protein